MIQTDFYNLDTNTGMWELAETKEHPSTGVAKLTNQLNERTKIVISNLSQTVRSTITKIQNTQEAKQLFQVSIDLATNEIHHHCKMFHFYSQRVIKALRYDNDLANKGHPSPRFLLERISDAHKLTPLNDNLSLNPPRLHLPSLDSARNITSTHQHLGPEEIITKIRETKEHLQNIENILPAVEFCWNRITALSTEDNPEELLVNMRKIHADLELLKNEETFNEIYDAFFYIEDATEGLLHIDDYGDVKIDEMEATLKLVNATQRTMLRAIDNFNYSYEKTITEKAFKKIKIFNKHDIQSGHIKALELVPLLFDIEPVAHPSRELCYRKFGELHANIRQKRLELASLSYLEKYFPFELISLSNIAMEELLKLQQEFLKVHDEIGVSSEIKRDTIAEENIRELDISGRQLVNSLFSTDSIEKKLLIVRKLHAVNLQVSERYSVFSEAKLQKCIAILGSDSFKNFVSTLVQLMFELRNEQFQHGEVVIQEEDFRAVENCTGKFTMISSYFKALGEILAPLSTFMGNSLHALVKEMIKNIPLTDKDSRAILKHAYYLTSNALEEVNREILTNSSVVKK